MTQKLIQEVGDNVYVGFVSPLPGASDIAVSHGVFRHKGVGGHGKTANRVRVRQIADMGYSVVMCTVNLDNRRQITILESEGWTLQYTYYNQRTTSRCRVYFKDLQKDYEYADTRR
jgi:hypothetical protein